MSREDIDRLLGGYATDSLTEEEKKTLFDAALDDQELFDALQQEQALRDLFSDPVSKQAVLAALQEPPQKHSNWFARPWIWGVTGSLVAACVLVAVLVRWDNGQPSTGQQVAIVTKQEPEVERQLAEGRLSNPKPTPPSGRPVASADKRAKRDEGTVKKSEPAPIAPQPENLRAGAKEEEKQADVKSSPVSPVLRSGTGGAPQQQNAGVRDSQQQNSVEVSPHGPSIQNAQQNRVRQFAPPGETAGALGSAFSAYKSAQPAIRYFILRPAENGQYAPVPAGAPLHKGDSIRLTVVPHRSGSITLFRQESNGQWKLAYPASEDGVPVLAGQPYTIPDPPIELKQEENLRVVLSAPEQAELRAMTKSMGALSRKRRAENEALKDKAQVLSTTIEITLKPVE